MVLIFLAFLPLPGCIAQQPDLKQTEKTLQQRIKQSSDESAQTRARQSQEISSLREQELPQLRGELERALHQAQELQGKQEDLKQRMNQIEQQIKKLEQLVVGKAERPLEGGTNPQGKDAEARLDTHDEVISSLLVQIADLSKRIKAIEKK
jgi:predicted nuclease with TOPRIM domain